MFKLIRRLISLIIIGHILYIFLLKVVFPPITITQFNSWRSGEGLQRTYVSMDKINSSIKWAVIAAEDQKYGSHNGFDFDAIKDIWISGEGLAKKRGGSTISQQVAKNVFLWQGKSWLRKGIEAYFTWLIELIWGKERILEIYLNVIEMGPGIYGIEAASQNYFNKSAESIGNQESARIAASLSNPKDLKVQPPSPFVQKRSQWVLKQMQQLKGTPELEAIIQSKPQ